MDLRQSLIACAVILSEDESAPLSNRNPAVSKVECIMEYIVEKGMVLVCGDPFQRLGAYMLEGIRARLLSSGSILDNKLKCKEPNAPEMMSYMELPHNIYPYYKFSYLCAYIIMRRVIEGENNIHIIDFQIAQGVQWGTLIRSFANRPGGPPFIRVTRIDDFYLAHARGGGLDSVGQRLAKVAESCGIPFQFHGLAISASEVKLENLILIPGEPLAMNLPYIMHHIPDESVSVENHRERILHLVKSLSPKIVTLFEQESNTNTGTFLNRFCETLDYYSASFEFIDAFAVNRNDKLRISAEQHCLAKEIVNMIACDMYGQGPGFPYGYPNPFHGGHAHHTFPQHGNQQQQDDSTLKLLLLVIGISVLLTLVWS